MGDAIEKDGLSPLSWEGKVHDNPKPYGAAVSGNTPLTEKDLAEFEQKMLKLFQEMAEHIAREQINARDKGTSS